MTSVQKPRKAGRPRRGEAAQKADRLVKAATAIFTERGYKGASIEQIADAAGVARSTIYAQYGDKYTLFRSVLLALIDNVAFDTLAEPDLLPIEEGLLQRARILLTATARRDYLGLYRILLGEGSQYPEVKIAYARMVQDRIVEGLSGYLDSKRATGVRLAGDSGSIALVFAHLLIAYVTLNALRGEPEASEIDQHARELTQVFLYGTLERDGTAAPGAAPRARRLETPSPS
jgi:AcrR family transcriptional regulator